MPIESEDGTIKMVPGALAGLDEDEVGWCLQLTDEGLSARVISSLGPEYEGSIKEIAEGWARERLERAGNMAACGHLAPMGRRRLMFSIG